MISCIELSKNVGHFFPQKGADITLYISKVFHCVFQNTHRGDRRIYLVVISYYTVLVSPCGIHYMYTHLFPEARAQRLLVCGRALQHNRNIYSININISIIHLFILYIIYYHTASGWLSRWRIRLPCGRFWVCAPVGSYQRIGRLRFHNENDNEYENDNEISLSFSLRFCTQRDERLIASVSSFTTTITNRNQGITHEMNMSAHKNVVLVLVVVVVVKS